AVADALAASLTKDPAQRLAQVGDLVRGLSGAPLPPRNLRATAPQSESPFAPPVAPPGTEIVQPRRVPPAPAVPAPVSTPVQRSIPPHIPPSAYTPPTMTEQEPEQETGASLTPPLFASSLWQRA